MATGKLCAVEDCGKPYHAHGYCATHAYHFKAHGDPLGGRHSASPGEPLRWIYEQALFYESDECLTWPFERTRHGYGSIKHNGKKRVASRVMCEVVHGPQPTPEHEACHSCGRGHEGCMAPRHLRWGTRTENVQDAKLHGTWNHGETVPAAKLTECQIKEIRGLKGIAPQRELGNRYGVGQGTISRIVNRKRWAWMRDMRQDATD